MDVIPPPTAAGLSPGLQASLAELYRDLDLEVRTLGVGCWVRGDCCDFRLADHTLYASSVEIAFVLEKHRGRTRPAAGEASELCPFWKDGKCGERERRPLGCRTYFCDARHREALQALYEKYHRRLQELAAAYSHPWRYERFVPAVRAGLPGSPDPEGRAAVAS